MIDWIATASYGAFSGHAQTALRVLYGALLFAQLLYTIPSARRFFASAAYGGYMESSPRNDRLHTPLTATFVLVVWLICALSIATGIGALYAALVNFCLARYFFLSTRWQSILRGMGAPGHMNHWLAALVFLLLVSERVDTRGFLHAMTVITFRVDFAAIMIAAGIYKIAAGYARGEGFEIGLVNPWWGHNPYFGRVLSGNSPVFRIMNHAAYLTEILCGIGFLVPAIAPFAGLALALSFLVIGRMIRLTALAEMVAVSTLLYVFPGAIFDRAIAFFPAPLAPAGTPMPFEPLALLLGGMLMLYLACLPFAYVGMAINFYGKHRLLPALQWALDRFTQFFGLILWRVFTADVINFYATIEIDRDGSREEIPIPGRLFGRWGMRYRHVGEFITLASLFTTLKYYPHEPELFEKRILRYARSLSDVHRIVFTYVAIAKESGRFSFRPVAEFVVDPRAQTVTERVLDPTFDVRSPAAGSPVSPGTSPGSYAPATS